MMNDADDKEYRSFPIFDVVLSAGLALCFTVVLSLFVVRFFHKISSCCLNLFHTKPKNTLITVEGGSSSRSNDKYKRRLAKLQYEPLPLDRFKSNQMSLSLESLTSYKSARFEIPGKTTVQTVQPIDTTSTSGYHGSGVLSEDEKVANPVFTEEYIQPVDQDAISLSMESNLHSSIISEDGLNVDMYTSEIRHTQSTGSLGKMKFSLQYEDNMNRKLILKMQTLDNMHFTRFNEHAIGIRLQVLLLPDRETKYDSQLLSRTSRLDLDETFYFYSKPHHRDFESRTIHLIVNFVEKSMKETIYGEARLPLLNHEIYSQVPTDISIGIRPCPPQNEIGDVQICLSYVPEQKKLVVMVKTVKFINSSLMDNLTSIHIKAHLTRLGGEKMGKKRSVSKSLSSRKSRQIVDFQDHMTFKLDLENFLLCTLKLNLHGKHRILGNHLSLGKIRLGEGNRDEGGKIHWKLIMNSDGIGWSMWHPIYSS